MAALCLKQVWIEVDNGAVRLLGRQDSPNSRCNLAPFTTSPSHHSAFHFPACNSVSHSKPLLFTRSLV